MTRPRRESVPGELGITCRCGTSLDDVYRTTAIEAGVRRERRCGRCGRRAFTIERIETVRWEPEARDAYAARRNAGFPPREGGGPADAPP